MPLQAERAEPRACTVRACAALASTFPSRAAATARARLQRSPAGAGVSAGMPMPSNAALSAMVDCAAAGPAPYRSNGSTRSHFHWDAPR